MLLRNPGNLNIEVPVTSCNPQPQVQLQAIEHQPHPRKESSGRFQYGLNTPDGVNMVVLMVEDTLEHNVGHGDIAIANLLLLRKQIGECSRREK